MVEPTEGVTEGGARVEDLLLAAKLWAPRPRRAAASRISLIERVQASGATVVSVVAPAGYGKSTLLAEWAAHERRAVAWVSLDVADDDPATLLRSLATACAAFSAPAADVVAEMRSVGSTLGRAAPLLASALGDTPDPFVLFVDDVHSASSPGCRDVLDVVTGRIPEGSQVVLAGRQQQAYLARRRATGDVVEIGAADLRVDVGGARAIFDAAGATTVSESALFRAWERCEGWPAGIHLCALIARDGSEELSVVGDDRFVADYLYSECLERLPDATQQFLRRTAVLDQLTGTSCDAVLESTGSQRRLHELEALNLFVVPLDRTRGWYRYHALFREFLLAELDRVEPGLAAVLHRRAASWYETQGVLAAAIEHSLAAGDRARSVQLVAEAALPTYQMGRAGVVSRWLAQLGRDAVASYPPLAAIACWMALLLGESVEAERWADVLERIVDTGDTHGERLAVESARAMIRAAMCLDGPQRALDDAAFAVASEPVWSPWRDQAVHLYGSALLLVGDEEGARAAFVDGSAIAAASGSADSIILCEADLAVLAINRGDWDQAATHSSTALDVVKTNHMVGYGTAALAYGVGARVALRAGRDDDAERWLAQGMRARVLCTYVLPILSVRVRLQLAKAYDAKGDRAAARALADEMADTLRRRSLLGVLADEVVAFRGQLERLPHDAAGTSPLSPAELRLLPYLQTHLTLSEIGERLHVSRNTVNTQTAAIYRKLGVNSRRAAVERATDVCLLGD